MKIPSPHAVIAVGNRVECTKINIGRYLESGIKNTQTSERRGRDPSSNPGEGAIEFFDAPDRLHKVFGFAVAVPQQVRKFSETVVNAIITKAQLPENFTAFFICIYDLVLFIRQCNGSLPILAPPPRFPGGTGEFSV